MRIRHISSSIDYSTYVASDYLKDDEARKEFIKDALQADFTSEESRGERILFLKDILQTLLDSYE